MNLIGHDEQWLMIDCGATFQAPLMQQEDSNPNAKTHDVVCADPTFIENRLHQLQGIVLTHAHEDHIGALPALIERFNCPIYATSFTAEVLKRKLYREDKAHLVNLVVVEPKKSIQIGEFNVKWLPITHSIPDSNAMFIETKVGNIFHSADWKMDKSPVQGKPFNKQLFSELANKKPFAMLCDSTNALKEGYTPSESDCYEGLSRLVGLQKGRVVVTCFGSNLARLMTLAKIAAENGRYMALLGRSLENMYSIARSQEIWPDELKLANRRHMGYLPKQEVLLVATGSQGEPRAALGRLANETHPDCDLESGDCVIYSSIVIPGNEKPILRMVNKLKGKGIEVYQSENCEFLIHASGHPSQRDLFDMYQLIKPKVVIPTHGEAEHMAYNAKVSHQAGILQNLVGKNGDLFLLKPVTSIKRGFASSGRIDITR
ncbi:ribonuclease J [Glaciecola sp. KUL10]|uniref:ribonuclease J n=1 Tax=Glaciecola sp. (strain KUL10) TaxID=2161813 RepID=UPI001F2AF08F|nr:ribonuclease J [Glaciecola sp. KUL10]